MVEEPKVKTAKKTDWLCQIMTPRMAAKLNGTEIQAATEAIKIARGVGAR